MVSDEVRNEVQMSNTQYGKFAASRRLVSQHAHESTPSHGNAGLSAFTAPSMAEGVAEVTVDGVYQELI